VNEKTSPASSRVNPTRLIAGGDGGGEGGDGEGGGGEGEGGGGEGEGGGETTAQIVKPVPMTELSLDQVTVVPATTCTFIGPVEPEYAAFPILMKS
jgi:hypothetical protein